MYSDELPGEGQEAVAGPARVAPPMRSSSGMSDSGARQSGSIVRGSGSMMSSQMGLADDPGSNRASLMGSNRGSVHPKVMLAAVTSSPSQAAALLTCRLLQSCLAKWADKPAATGLASQTA